MPLTLNHNRLQNLLDAPFPPLAPNALRRKETVFFIGGNLPINETLETMYESYCQESTDLFHVTFGDRDHLDQNLELVRQIKKNFSVRTMGRIAYGITETIAEQAYLAGLDILDIPHLNPGKLSGTQGDWQRHAAGIFPRWSLVSSLHPGTGTAGEVRNTMDYLLAAGIVPLPVITAGSAHIALPDAAATFAYLITAWQHHGVQVKPLLPLVRLMTPLESNEPAGFIRGVINRIQDRHLLATSDLRRHLRTSGAEASFESAGL